MSLFERIDAPDADEGIEPGRRLIKVGGWVRECLDRVRLRLATSHPSERWWRALMARRVRT